MILTKTGMLTIEKKDDYQRRIYGSSRQAPLVCV